jgi:hypothetical protein
LPELTRVNLSALFGDLVSAPRASPNWARLVLIFYTLTVFELVPRRVYERMHCWLGRRFFAAAVAPTTRILLNHTPALGISKFRNPDYPQPVQNNRDHLGQIVTLGDLATSIEGASAVKKTCLYLLGTAVLLVALANPPKTLADGWPGPNCPSGQQCKP